MAWRRLLQTAGKRETRPGMPAYVISDPPHVIEQLGALASVLTEHSVPYAVIGGFAIWHWLPDHQPADIDIIVAPGRRTRMTLPDALADILKRWPGDASPEVLPPPDLLATGHGASIATGSGKLQIVGASLPARCSRRAIVRHRQWFSIGGKDVAICTLTDLISIKQGTGRESDARHVQALQSLFIAGKQQT